MTRRILVIIFAVTGLLSIYTNISRAESVDLLGVLFKLERMRDDATVDIQKYEGEIQKCNSTIMKTKRIISLAQQKGNEKVGTIAQEALTNAKEAMQKNQELKNRAELRRKKADIAYANVRNLMAEQLDVKTEIKSVVTSSSGNVFILSKRLGQTIPLGDERAGFLEPGDEIWTPGSSSAELQFLGGRGTLKLGEYSKLRMEEDSEGGQVVNVLRGKIYTSVDKLDDYRKMLLEGAEKFSDKYDELLKKINKKLEENLPPRVRSLESMGAIRGTKFEVKVSEVEGTEWIVLRGVVDVKAIKGDESVSVDAGYRVRVTKDGVISKPEKIDLKKLKRWWEK